MRRLIHLAMLLAVLLGGPVLPAWAMPCCAGSVAQAGKANADAVSSPEAHEDSMQGMPSCHHKSAFAASANIRCAHGVCMLQRQTPAPEPQALTLSADFLASPTLIESRLHRLVSGHTALQRALQEPSPPAAMPLPLRV